MILSTTFNFFIITILIYSYLFKNLLNIKDNQIYNLDLLYGLVNFFYLYF